MKTFSGTDMSAGVKAALIIALIFLLSFLSLFVISLLPKPISTIVFWIIVIGCLAYATITHWMSIRDAFK